jgi:hypothetical protein
MMKAYRKGAIGALMDEYERAASELKLLIGRPPTISMHELSIRSPKTKTADQFKPS